MSLAVLIGTPLVVGAISVYGLKDETPTVQQMASVPLIAIGLMLAGSAITLLEGSICIAIMAPLFLLVSSIGGVLMGLGLRWVKGSKHKLLSIAFLPFAIFMSEDSIELTNRKIELTQSTIIQAQPMTIWQEIVTAKEIRSDELPFSLVHLIGVPKPLEGVNVQSNGEEIRYTRWEKGVNFKAKVIDKEELRFIKWKYIFHEGSFPKGTMDEHVAIGGEYFDLQDTAFKLEPIDHQHTRLTIIAHYRVSSRINFYAVPVSKLLGKDFINVILTLYKNRSEKAQLGHIP